MGARAQGSYAFKFVVDGKWRNADDAAFGVDDKGNTNNVVLVSERSHQLTGALGAP